MTKHEPRRGGRLRVAARWWLLLGTLLGLSALFAGMAFAASGREGSTARPGAAARTGAESGPLTKIVHTTHGDVRGRTVITDGYPTYQTFFGVRYGQDTGGVNRWLPPKPVSWTGIYDASDFGPFAPQSWNTDSGDSDPAVMNEDCLRLNIWTPKADHKKRAVLVFIHGGGFTGGTPNQSWFSGKRFPRDNVVFVSMSYRVGPLGFMYVGDVPGATDAYKASGNLGLLDQRLALKWVHDNIAKFGGDPDRVTLCGQSAGARSATIHMTLPASNKYFRRCIAMSGTPNCGGLDWAKKVTGMYMAEAGATNLDQLKSLSLEQLLDAHDAMYVKNDYNWWCILWRPIIDGVVIKQDPKVAIAHGAGRNIALMQGTTADELNCWLPTTNWGSTFGTPEATIPSVCADVAAHPTLTETWPAGWAFVYERMVANAVEESGKTPQEMEDAVINAHPGATPFWAWMNLIGDLTYHLPAIRMDRNRCLAPGHKDNTWVYVYDWDCLDFYDNGTYGADDCRGYPEGAAHAADIAFAFGIPDEWSLDPWYEFAPYEPGHEMEADYGTWYPLKVWPDALTASMHQAWCQFAKTGDPNNRFIPHWPTYRLKAGQKAMHFDTMPNVQKNAWADLNQLWQAATGIDPLFECPVDTAIPLASP